MVNTNDNLQKPTLTFYKDLRSQYKGTSLESQLRAKVLETRRIELQNNSISVTILGNYEGIKKSDYFKQNVTIEVGQTTKYTPMDKFLKNSPQRTTSTKFFVELPVTAFDGVVHQHEKMVLHEEVCHMQNDLDTSGCQDLVSKMLLLDNKIHFKRLPKTVLLLLDSNWEKPGKDGDGEGEGVTILFEREMAIAYSNGKGKIKFYDQDYECFTSENTFDLPAISNKDPFAKKYFFFRLYCMMYPIIKSAREKVCNASPVMSVTSTQKKKERDHFIEKVNKDYDINQLRQIVIHLSANSDKLPPSSVASAGEKSQALSNLTENTKEPLQTIPEISDDEDRLLCECPFVLVSSINGEVVDPASNNKKCERFKNLKLNKHFTTFGEINEVWERSKVWRRRLEKNIEVSLKNIEEQYMLNLVAKEGFLFELGTGSPDKSPLEFSILKAIYAMVNSVRHIPSLKRLATSELTLNTGYGTKTCREVMIPQLAAYICLYMTKGARHNGFFFDNESVNVLYPAYVDSLTRLIDADKSDFFNHDTGYVISFSKEKLKVMKATKKKTKTGGAKDKLDEHFDESNI